ncbi:hypothetical protein AVEN_223118-1 [Araneus ventricosus]|uniref:Uncharacterized protein n=1 Tax=Araneus ventricosus TaxID=182803 RepID=A0A4Y2EDS0_ARAVE|nr:hypothetical protein AVEN_223118-1 [Araneus ventricosus]
MKIGVDRGRGWNSNIVGFPFILFGYKREIRFFEAGDKSPACVWERWGGENLCGSQTGEIRAERGECSLQSENPPLGKRECEWLGEGSKQHLERFGAIVNGPPI